MRRRIWEELREGFSYDQKRRKKEKFQWVKVQYIASANTEKGNKFEILHNPLKKALLINNFENLFHGMS